MTILTVCESIVDHIEQYYPAANYPAENAYFCERYSHEPAVTLALQEAVDRCLAAMSRHLQMNPQLDEDEAREIAQDKFLERFAQTIHDEAQAIFDGVGPL